ncbi:MAG: META domain-containing protein [Pseudomonadota bacterium]
MRAGALAFLGLVVACGPPLSETVSAPASDQVWHLVSLDGEDVTTGLTLRFLPDGSVSGEGSCNRFSARQTAPLPWFELGSILATKRGCATLDDEQALFQRLAEMRFAEIQGEVLLLSGPRGDMFFRAKPV